MARKWNDPLPTLEQAEQDARVAALALASAQNELARVIQEERDLTKRLDEVRAERMRLQGDRGRWGEIERAQVEVADAEPHGGRPASSPAPCEA